MTGKESQMADKPEFIRESYTPSNKLKDKVAFITGGDSGIGRAVAVLFAQDGANIAIGYLDEDKDAKKTQGIIEEFGQQCILVPGDIGNEEVCKEAIKKVVSELGGINILVNNAAEQRPTESIQEISSEQLQETFQTNIFSMFYLVKAALEHMEEGDSIINTTSVTAYKGNPTLLDYSSTKGAIVSFTRSLALNLVDKGIRVNAVAPGPIWTPLIPSTFKGESLETFGKDTPMKRAGQPEEVAPAFLFLASQDSSYMTGQVLHPNGGAVING